MEQPNWTAPASSLKKDSVHLILCSVRFNAGEEIYLPSGLAGTCAVLEMIGMKVKRLMIIIRPCFFYHYYFSDFIYRQGLSKANGQWPESRKYQQIGGNSVSCHKTTGKEAGIPSHSLLFSPLSFILPLYSPFYLLYVSDLPSTKLRLLP